MTNSLTVANRWNQSHCANESVTVKHNSLPTEMSLLNVISCDLKAWYIQHVSFFHLRPGFISFNASTTPFPFHPMSSSDHPLRPSENIPGNDFSEGLGHSIPQKALSLLASGMQSWDVSRDPILLAPWVTHAIVLAIWLIYYIVLYGSE